MTLTLCELKRVSTVLNSKLKRGRIQDIRHPTPDVLVLQVRSPGHTDNLLVHVGARQARIHITAHKWPNTPTPTGFVSKLRKELLGATLEGVVCAPDDRVVTIEFSRSATTDGQVTPRLLCELTGHHPNIFLVEPSGVILTLMLPNSSRLRRLQPGYVYEPPLQSDPPASDVSISDRFSSVSDTDLFPTIEALYSTKDDVNERQERWNLLLRAAISAIRKTESTLAKVTLDAQRASGADDIRQRAELIKAALPQLSQKVESVTVTDWYDPELKPVVIALNPAFDPKTNVEKMFHNARRLSAAAQFISDRLNKVKRTLDHLRGIRDGITAKEHVGNLDVEADQLRVGGWLKEARQSIKRSESIANHLCYREFVSATGSRIWVGKSAQDNDTLTVRLARSHDIWLHATGRKGAHVVLRLEKNQSPSPDALTDAAFLAAHYSEGGQNDSGVEVAWTYRKYVRKSKHAAPGAVTYSQAKTLWITPDPERRIRLMQNGPNSGLMP